MQMIMNCTTCNLHIQIMFWKERTQPKTDHEKGQSGYIALHAYFLKSIVEP